MKYLSSKASSPWSRTNGASQDFSRVRLIRLRLGALGHAEPEALRFCFDAVTRGTIADGAKLDIDMVPGEGMVLRLPPGRSRLTIALPHARSAATPRCRSPPAIDLRLAELEVE